MCAHLWASMQFVVGVFVSWLCVWRNVFQAALMASTIGTCVSYEPARLSAAVLLRFQVCLLVLTE